MTAKLVPEDIIISDATVLINFLETNSFSLLLNLFESRLHITDVVLGEVVRKKSELMKLIEKKKIVLHTTSIDMIAHLEKSFPGLNVGEASCLVLAKEKSWKVATDDSKAKMYIKKDLNKMYIVTTFDILVQCTQAGNINKKGALQLIKDMENKANFVFNQIEYDEFLNKL